jgi:hypothetical protein
MVEWLRPPRLETTAMPSLLERPVSRLAWLNEAGRRNGPSSAITNGAGASQRDISNAGSWESTVLKLVEFQHLGDNWDGLGAPAPSAELVASAIGLAYLLYENGMEPPSAVAPGLDCAVNLEWHDPDGTFCEIEIDRPLHAEVMVIEPGKPPRHWNLATE